MTTHPTAAELLQAAIDWLGAPPACAPQHAYLARVARNALAIVLREHEQGPAMQARATARLHTLLGLHAVLPLLEAELASRLRHGAIALDDPAMLQHLRLHTLDRLAIDQPSYKHGLTS